MKVYTELLADVASCTSCSEHLPLGPRPVLQLHPNARILIAGQAPGKKVHSTGIPFDDASGDRLREWMGISKDTFYDEKQVAILPMGFCYPGTGKSGDLPPRPECKQKWREQLLAQLSNVEITLVLGKYAQDYHFGHFNGSLTELVGAWEQYWSAHGNNIGRRWYHYHIPVREITFGLARILGLKRSLFRYFKQK